MKAALLKRKDVLLNSSDSRGDVCWELSFLLLFVIDIILFAYSLFYLFATEDFIGFISYFLLAIFILFLSAAIFNKISDVKTDEELELINVQILELGKIEEAEKICEKYKLKLVSQ